MSVSNRVVYATQPRPLRDQIHDLLKKPSPEAIEGQITAIVVPDANLLKGGEVAANVYKLLEGRSYDTVIIVTPSHIGGFNRIHICNVDVYHTPFGELHVNDQIRNELCDEDDDIFLDNRGHFHTEGIDVQLPFLQTVLEGSFDIVPIVMGDESPDLCRELGHAIGEVMYNRKALLVVTANILEADLEALQNLKEHFELADVSRLMSFINSDALRIEGRGPLLVGLIASLHRKADRIRVLAVTPPSNGMPGFVGAILARR